MGKIPRGNRPGGHGGMPPGLNGGVVVGGGQAARQEAEQRQEVMKAVNATGWDQAEPGELGWEPVGDRVAVRIHEVTETVSGLTLPGGSDSIRTVTATVLAAGPKCEQLKAGDVVSCDPGAAAFPHLWEHGKFFVGKEGQFLGVHRPRGVRAATAEPAAG